LHRSIQHIFWSIFFPILAKKLLGKQKPADGWLINAVLNKKGDWNTKHPRAMTAA
jgi:hypothetical protein